METVARELAEKLFEFMQKYDLWFEAKEMGKVNLLEGYESDLFDVSFDVYKQLGKLAETHPKLFKNIDIRHLT